MAEFKVSLGGLSGLRVMGLLAAHQQVMREAHNDFADRKLKDLLTDTGSVGSEVLATGEDERCVN
ncbi:MAG: hypothetical protein H7Y89_16305 [Steroidobacteraceae bacterium]|nr:hypothetical protein [Steroidobacteraceae bacterium]